VGPGLGQQNLTCVPHVRDVVGDREQPVLARHPTGHHLAGLALVETVEALQRGERPALRARELAERLQALRRMLAVAVETEDQRMAFFSRRQGEQQPAVRPGRERTHLRGCARLLAQRRLRPSAARSSAARAATASTTSPRSPYSSTTRTRALPT